MCFPSKGRAVDGFIDMTRAEVNIGFVLPKSNKLGGGRVGGPWVAAPAFALRATAGRSTQPRGGRDGGPRIARSAASGFVLPKSAFARLRASGCGGQALQPSADKSAQPGGGRDGDPRVAASAPDGRGIQGIECPDRGFSSRQRTALIAVEPHQPRRDVVLAEAFRHDPQAHAADAQDVDLRFGDAERGGAVRLAGALPGDPLRQGRGLGRERRIGQHRQAQAVAQRVARHHGLAGTRARAGAARRIGAVGGADPFIRACSRRRSGFRRIRRRPRSRGIRSRHIVSLGHAASRICRLALRRTPAEVQRSHPRFMCTCLAI
jgi:hypothetical protein